MPAKRSSSKQGNEPAVTDEAADRAVSGTLEHVFDIAYPRHSVEVTNHLPWSQCVPDGMTALLLDQPLGDASSLPDDFERLERIGAWEKIIAWAQARQYAEIADVVSLAQSSPADGFTPAEAVESAEAEIGLMLRLSTGSAGWRVAEARRLVEQFPAAFAALGTGSITMAKARIITEGCIDLGPGLAAAVEARVLPRAPEQTNGQLRAAVRRAVLRADSEAAQRRHRRKRRERGVVVYPERDGMAVLSATLPAAEAVGAFAVLDQHARACGGTDERPMDARRADALVDLVLRDTGFCSDGSGPANSPASNSTEAGSNPDTSSAEPSSTFAPSPAPDDGTSSTPGTAPGAGSGPASPGTDRLPGLVPAAGIRTTTNSVSVQIRVTVPFDVLRGTSTEPADLAGYGPITAEQARLLAGDPDSAWHRLVTDPLSGALLDYGTTRYRPPPHLAEHVIARHQTCQFPGCRTPAHRCDLDHNVAFDPVADEGNTSSANLGPKCRPHHRLKGYPGWSVTQYSDGTIIWATPSGHSFQVDPPPVTEPRGRAGPTVGDNDPPPF